MAIGIVSDADFERELGNVLPTKPQIIELPHKGRSDGDVNVPESLRKIIGEDAVLNGSKSAIALAESLGISKSSVSAYKNGATSTTSYHNPSQAIIGHINKSRARATKRAGKTLNAALAAITQEKLDYTDAKDLAAIAKNMSGIIKDLEPPQSNEDGSIQKPQFVVYAPTFRDERSYDSITVSE